MPGSERIVKLNKGEIVLKKILVSYIYHILISAAVKADPVKIEGRPVCEYSDHKLLETIFISY